MSQKLQYNENSLFRDAVFTAPQILGRFEREGSSQNNPWPQGSGPSLSAVVRSANEQDTGTMTGEPLTSWHQLLAGLSTSFHPHQGFEKQHGLRGLGLPNSFDVHREVVGRYLDVENLLLKGMAGSIYNVIYPELNEPIPQDDVADPPRVLPMEWLRVFRRVRHLRNEAAKNEELFSVASEKAFREFFHILPFNRVPSIFLLENGNLRAVWKSGGQQIGLQFRSDDDIQFVFFFKRQDADQIKPVYGRDSQKGIIQLIENFSLSHLLF